MMQKKKKSKAVMIWLGEVQGEESRRIKDLGKRSPLYPFQTRTRIGTEECVYREIAFKVVRE